MDLRTSTGPNPSITGLTPSSFKAFKEFAETPNAENKIVVGFNGHTIQIATPSPSSATNTEYLRKNGSVEDFPEDKKNAIIDHFQNLLAREVGSEKASTIFPEHEATQARLYGLDQHTVKQVVAAVTLEKTKEIEARGSRMLGEFWNDSLNTPKPENKPQDNSEEQFAPMAFESNSNANATGPNSAIENSDFGKAFKSAHANVLKKMNGADQEEQPTTVPNEKKFRSRF